MYKGGGNNGITYIVELYEKQHKTQQTWPRALHGASWGKAGQAKGILQSQQGALPGVGKKKIFGLTIKIREIYGKKKYRDFFKEKEG